MGIKIQIDPEKTVKMLQKSPARPIPVTAFGRNEVLPYLCYGKRRKWKGNGIVPFFISHKCMDSHVQAIEQMIKDILAEEPAYFLVEMKVKPTNNLKVFLDGDQGITIEKCITINRALYRRIEVAGFFPGGDFSLEVSSPGTDEPLKLLRQYKKNIGRSVEVLLKDGMKTTGKMIEVQDAFIVVEETKGKNKKKEVLQHNFQFDNIKSTKIQTVF